MLTDDFLATLAGAAVAGGVGILTLLVQQRLDAHRRLDEELLAPAFGYVMSLPTSCPWVTLLDPPWTGLDPYRWLTIPRKYRLPLREMASRVEAYGKSYAGYFQFMGETGLSSFDVPVKGALSKYLSPDTSVISARKTGVDDGSMLQIQWLVGGIVPYVLLNPKDEDAAWDQLVSTAPNLLFWAKQIVPALRKNDPASLTRLFAGISESPDAPKGREVVTGLVENYTLVLGQAAAVGNLLAKRLRVNVESRAA